MIRYLLIVVVLFVDVSEVNAQTQPSWNRRVTGLAITPTVGGPVGTFDLEAKWRIHLEGSTTSPVELGTAVDLSIAGGSPTTMTAEECLIWELDAGGEYDCTGQPSGTVCGTATIGGVSGHQLTCDAGTGACATPPFTVTFSNIALIVGDDVSLALTAASGAERDTQTDDDTGSLIYGSWNRRLLNVVILPDHDGPAGTYKIIYDWIVELSSTSTLDVNISSDVDVNVNDDSCCQEACCCPQCKCSKSGCGGSDPDCIIWDIQDAGSCSTDPEATCGSFSINGQSGLLTCDQGSCITEIQTDVVSNVSLSPGDEIMVILFPSPGALPEPETGDDAIPIIFSGETVPTLSEWGLVVMTALLFVFGTVMIRRQGVTVG